MDTWCIDNQDGWTVHTVKTEAEADAVLRGEVIKGLKGGEYKRYGSPRWSPAAREATWFEGDTAADLAVRTDGNDRWLVRITERRDDGKPTSWEWIQDLAPEA